MTKRRLSRKARARSQAERNIRLKEVLRRRIILNQTNAEIAIDLNVTERTIERDFRLLKDKIRKDAEKNLEHEIRDMAEGLKLSHAEKIRCLWKEYLRLEQMQGEAKENAEKKLEIQEETRSARMSIIRQITATEDSFVEQMKRMGIAKETLTLDVPGRAIIYLPDNKRGDANAGNG